MPQGLNPSHNPPSCPKIDDLGSELVLIPGLRNVLKTPLAGEFALYNDLRRQFRRFTKPWG